MLVRQGEGLSEVMASEQVSEQQEGVRHAKSILGAGIASSKA